MTYPSDRFPYIVGGWSEYMYLPPKAWVYKVPEYLPIEFASMSELIVVAALLDRAKEFSAYAGKGFHFGDTVVVQGAGPVGMMMMVKARMLGAGKVIARPTGLAASPLVKRYQYGRPGCRPDTSRCTE